MSLLVMLVFVGLKSSSSMYIVYPYLPWQWLQTNWLGKSVTPTLLNHTITTNLTGAFYAVQAAARQMAYSQSPPGGSIIGVSSISALVGGGQQTHYTPTKAGVLSLMQSTAVALGKYGIRCNALLPGTIRTQLNDEDMSDPVKREYMEGRIPLGRLGQPPDLAGPAVFLACEGLSGYVVSFLLFLFRQSVKERSANDRVDWSANSSRWGIVCESSVIWHHLILVYANAK